MSEAEQEKNKLFFRANIEEKQKRLTDKKLAEG